MQQFLPVNKKEMKQRGWEQVDFAYITGDAYVDHPSGLEKERKHPGFWRTAPRLSGFCRKYGFHGQSLHGVKETQTEGFLFSGWTDGSASGPCRGRLQQPDPSDL